MGGLVSHSLQWYSHSTGGALLKVNGAREKACIGLLYLDNQSLQASNHLETTREVLAMSKIHAWVLALAMSVSGGVLAATEGAVEGAAGTSGAATDAAAGAAAEGGAAAGGAATGGAAAGSGAAAAGAVAGGAVTTAGMVAVGGLVAATVVITNQTGTTTNH